MTKSVIIIGAGFAGLGAAQALLSRGSGVKVTVLEGGQRVGGRAHTQDVPGLGRVEFGATYFHGLASHPLYEVAVNSGLMDPVQSREYAWGFLREGQGTWLTTQQAQAAQDALKEFAQAVDGCVAAGKRQQTEAVHTASSYTIGQHLEATLNEKRKHASKQEMDAFLPAWRWHELQLRINTAAPTSSNISTAWWGDYEELIGPNIPISCGFQAVAENIADGVDIRFGHVVEKIAWSNESVHVSCANGASFSADAVIVTVSLGVLKAQHQSLFEPQLPAWKTRAIEGLGFGLCEKIFVRLQPDAAAEQSQYSPHNQLCVAYHLLWDVPFPDCPPQEGVQQNGHPDPGSAPQGSLASQPEPVPWWASGLFSFRFGGSEFKPAYADPAQRATQPKSITFPEQKYTGSSNLIYGNSSGEVAYMASTHSPTGLPALQESQQGGCLWLAGAHAKVMDQDTDAEVARGIKAVLNTFPPLANGKDCATLPQIWRSRWGMDPLFLGSYSYMTGSSDFSDVDALAACIDDKLFFAGEAATSKYMGTMHGAYLTGQQAADALCQKFGHQGHSSQQ